MVSMSRSNSYKKFKDCIIKCSFKYKNIWIKANTLITLLKLKIFEYKVVLFSFKNMPSCFQRMSDYLNIFCYPYIDDIIIFFDDLSKHNVHIKLL